MLKKKNHTSIIYLVRTGNQLDGQNIPLYELIKNQYIGNEKLVIELYTEFLNMTMRELEVENEDLRNQLKGKTNETE